ncbi:hypothetical protein [Streptosporangium sp. NPDC002524]|uniref:hypothetical protein n=1 Tax=Streptosporangium sp. NPDC002524 TaxID=3154537 RepID=UPI00332079D2
MPTTPGAPGGDLDARDEWTCPGVSAHPVRGAPGRRTLDWKPVSLGPYRVLEHTCACRAVFYELISCGGSHMIHRVVQGGPVEHAFTGRWTSREAREMWLLLLTGQAR